MFNKIFTTVFIMLIVFSNLLYSQNYNWISPNTSYLKVYVINDGLIRINKTDFTNSGINTSVINPQTVKLFSKGVQIPIYFKGEDDLIFNEGDYINFYGKRNEGGFSTVYDQNNNPEYVKNEFHNDYSDTTVYWVGWGGENGLRFTNSSYSSSVLYTPDFYFSTKHFEKDKIYYQGQNIAGNDFRFLSNERFLGEGWYWTMLTSGQNISDTFSLPGLYGSPQSASLKVFAYPQNISGSILNEHTLEISVNGNIVSTILKNDFDKIDTVLNFSSSLLSSTSVNTISARYVSAIGFSGNIFFDFFELSYPGKFKLLNNKSAINLNSSDTTSKIFALTGYNSLNTVNIFDVKNNIRISNFSFNFDTLKFTAKSNSHLLIVNDTVRNNPLRIKQRSVPDLVSTANGVDYLIIYNSLFGSQAEQLRAYRESSDNYRSMKVEIEDILDIFNYGIEDPLAIRNFTKYVYDFWQLPKIKFICLIGRGSLDPKKNSLNSIYYKNFIPVFGNPNSDTYFGNVNPGTFFYNSQISVGRLPAYSASEAQIMVDKIIAYENEPPARWWKSFAYITGGATFSDQQSFQQRSNFEFNQYISGPPISGEGFKIYRNDFPGSTTFNFADSIKNTIDRGVLYVNYRGHAGSRDWEIGMTDPNTLNNGNRLPVITSLTCFTGEHAKTEFRGFGEKFIYLPGKGAIGFIGTSGWGFVSAGNDLVTYITQSLKIDSTRRIGDLLKIAGKNMSEDSLSFPVRHTVNCSNLLGDPAVRIKLPKYPEFVIQNFDYKLSPETVTLNEPVSLKITPKNYGLYADSCKIRFQLKKNNVNYLIKDTSYRAFKFLDTVKYNFMNDSPGVFTMTVLLDQNNRFPLEIEANNSISFTVPYSEYIFQPILPVDNSVVYKNSIELKGLNPLINYSTNSVKVFTQLDTSKLFNSPVMQTFVNNNLSGVDTKFNANLPVLNNNTIYYWRTNSVINNDTTGWIKTMNFVFNNIGLSDKNLKENLNKIQNKIQKEAEEDRYVGANTIIDIHRFNPDQYSDGEYFNTGAGNGGIKLNEYSTNLFIKSYGSNAEEASYFSIGEKNIYIDGGFNTGLNLLKLKKLDGNILSFINFKMTSSTSSDSLVNFLNTFDTTQYLMMLTAAYEPGGTYLTSSAKNKLRQFGSIFADSIGLMSYFHTWSLIGSLGADSSQVEEMFDPCCRPIPFCTSCDHWTPSISSKTVNFKRTNGSLSNIVGPAKEWYQFNWKSIVPQNSSLLFDIIGIDKNGVQTLLRSAVSTEKYVELSSISAIQYPKLNLLLKFKIDTVTGKESPVFNSLSVKYSPATEMIIDRNSLIVSPTKDDLSAVNFSFNYHNSGYAYINGSIINVYSNSVSPSNLILSDTTNSILKNDSTLSYSNNFTQLKSRDSVLYIINIKPKDLSNEFYTFNNTAEFKLNSKQELSGKAISVFSNGTEINSGDLISKNPQIKINYSGNTGTIDQQDTTFFSIYLNGNYIPYYSNGKTNLYINNDQRNDNFGSESISLNFNPSLENGKNKLSVIYKNSDNSDTVSYDVFVSGESAIKDFYNYPNPMKNETRFIFDLEGLKTEYIFKIRIYTVSGRLIKEIEYTARTGNNQILWDGKDNDGEYIANGTYIYKLVSEEDSFAEQKIQKLVILK